MLLLLLLLPLRGAASSVLLLPQVGWAEADYTLSCMDHDAMMADLSDPAGNCSLSATGALYCWKVLRLGFSNGHPAQHRRAAAMHSSATGGQAAAQHTARGCRQQHSKHPNKLTRFTC